MEGKQETSADIIAEFRGYAAALREALAEIRREINGYCDGCTLLDRMTEDPPDYTCLRDSLLKIERIADAALAKPPRNCDRFKSKYDSDKLHEAFVKHCNACDCPMGCIHRRDTRCMLDTRCGSILKCFAEFVLSETKGVNDEQK